VRLQHEGRWAPRCSRAFCVTAITYKLARRRCGSSVTATVLHPGVGRTAFGAEVQAALFTDPEPTNSAIFEDRQPGAATSTYLAASRQVEGGDRPVLCQWQAQELQQSANNASAGARLWQSVGGPGGLAQVNW
jgi:retinol dehydrogenase-14